MRGGEVSRKLCFRGVWWELLGSLLGLRGLLLETPGALLKKKARIFGSGSHSWVPLGAILGPSWSHLGALLSRLGSLSGRLGAPIEPFWAPGSLLGCPGAALGASWTVCNAVKAGKSYMLKMNVFPWKINDFGLWERSRECLWILQESVKAFSTDRLAIGGSLGSSRKCLGTF